MPHYDYTLKAIKDHFDVKPIQDITRDDYQLFLNDFGSTRAKETVSKVNGHIRSCVGYAIEELYKRLDDGLGYYIGLLGIMTGCRFGELVGLTRKDFDLKKNTIYK